MKSKAGFFCWLTCRQFQKKKTMGKLPWIPMVASTSTMFPMVASLPVVSEGYKFPRTVKGPPFAPKPEKWGPGNSANVALFWDG